MKQKHRQGGGSCGHELPTLQPKFSDEEILENARPREWIGNSKTPPRERLFRRESNRGTAANGSAVCPRRLRAHHGNRVTPLGISRLVHEASRKGVNGS